MFWKWFQENYLVNLIFYKHHTSELHVDYLVCTDFKTAESKNKQKYNGFITNVIFDVRRDNFPQHVTDYLEL